MHSDAQKHQAQQLEQVIATIFACRSVIKYNLSVDEKQQEKILRDIDTSLEMLRTIMTDNLTTQPHLSDRPLSQSKSTTIVHTHADTLPPDANAHETLQSLYRMYHAYLDLNEKTNLQSFVSRFEEVISVLEDVQRLFEQRTPIVHDLSSSSALLNAAPLPTVVENHLQKVKVFISDLYYIFMDFIRTLSAVLEQNNVQLNTEKISALPNQRCKKIYQRIQLEKFQNQTIVRAEEAYQQLRWRRMQVEPQISEATEFLESLKEILGTLDTKAYELNEMLAQTDTVSQLLSELLHIVTAYEKITKS